PAVAKSNRRCSTRFRRQASTNAAWRPECIPKKGAVTQWNRSGTQDLPSAFLTSAFPWRQFFMRTLFMRTLLAIPIATLSPAAVSAQTLEAPTQPTLNGLLHIQVVPAPDRFALGVPGLDRLPAHQRLIERSKPLLPI